MIDSRAEFSLHTLLYVVRAAANGDIKTLLKLGLRESQIHELLTLNSQELHDMASMSKAHFLNISFDPDALDIALQQNVLKSKRREQIGQLLAAGASFPVMSYLYGLTTEDIANYRKIMKLAKNEGRPATPSEETQNRIWEIMKPVSSFDDEGITEALLQAHRETGIKVSAIWQLLKQWWGNQQQINKPSAKLIR